MIASLSKTIAPGFHCRNESEIPILFVLSQLSPLHWCKVEPGMRELSFSPLFSLFTHQ